jgi:hypothetical protein
MATFIADFIFGKRDQRPRSRPSPAQRLLSHLRAPARPQPDAAPAEAHAAQTDTGPALARRAAHTRGPSNGLAG